MRNHLVPVVFLLLLVGLPATAFAQKKIELNTEKGLTIFHTADWSAGKPGKGAVAVLKSRTDDKAQIEFRFAGNMDVEKSERYFKTFHTNLQNAGLKVLKAPDAATYGERAGRESEYQTKGKKGEFRLVIWEVHDGKSAWIVVGFFSERARDEHVTELKSILNGLRFESPAPKPKTKKPAK